MVNWIKEKLRNWLSITDNANRVATLYHKYYALESKYNILDKRCSDLVNIGVDVHFKSPHMILIFSKLNGGQIRHIEANFSSLRDLQELVRDLDARYRPKEVFYDAPYPMNKELNQEREYWNGRLK